MSRTTTIHNFKAWLKENGCELHDDMDIAYSPQSGYSWIAKKDIAQETEIVSVTEGVCITRDSCRKLFHALSYTPLREDILVVVYLALHYNYDNQPDSLQRALKHRAYVAMLPPIGSTLTTLYWTPTELEYTQPTSLYNTTRERELQWQRDYVVVTDWLASNGLASFSYDVFKHSLTMLSSRSFPSKLISGSGSRNADTSMSSSDNTSGSSTPMLVPLWDIGNHKPMSAVVWKDSIYTRTSKIAISLPHGALEGSEVFNNYGAKATNELLLAYGFAVDNLEYDIVPFKVGAGAGMDFSQRKQDLLRKWNLLLEDGSLCTFNLSLTQNMPVGLRFLMRSLADENISDEGACSLQTLDDSPSTNQDIEFDLHAALFHMLENKAMSTSQTLKTLLANRDTVGESVLVMLQSLLTNQVIILTRAVDAIEEVLERLSA
ncbi:hypothetical protein E3P91_02152 [Wallemia ichthyophaga]|nr:hypothetical protein E3P91_02152 [Wallemia ichthyophaga]TIB63186.1 hypothetical protein E3P78_01995 [Wallemia ichthyophaga]